LKISLLTTSLGDRGPVLDRLWKQCGFLRSGQYEWIVCGPKELAPFVEGRAILVPFDGVIGTARNLSAEHASGDILVQLDDDDWQHPARLQKQVHALVNPIPGETQRPDLVGTSWLYCLVADRKIATRISYWDTGYVLPGATMAYHRGAWESCPFPDTMAEDGPFSGFFLKRGTAIDMRDPKLIIYMRGHGRAAHHVHDWWQETRHRLHTKSAQEIMLDRIKNPHHRLRWVEAPVDREAALAHEEESSTVYVRHMMGEHDFEWFCQDLGARQVGSYAVQ
jgi:glycosyltransferase involved in cell wall biosynthesis